jgi:uncharacterized protein DUF4864
MDCHSEDRLGRSKGRTFAYFKSCECECNTDAPCAPPQRSSGMLLSNMVRHFLGAILLSFAPFFSSAQAPLTVADALAVREVIEAQLDAFQKDDAPRAFSYATANIRASFGTPENFMLMVRTSYPVVYRPQAVKFEPPQVIDDEVVQPVRLTDVDGRTWIALYPMQREPDGKWRINGCQLARLAGQET